MPEALKSCPKSNKTPDLVTLPATYLHFNEVGTEPVNDFQVGWVVSVGVEVVLVRLLLVTLVVKDVPHLLEHYRVRWGQAKELEVPFDRLQ